MRQSPLAPFALALLMCLGSPVHAADAPKDAAKAQSDKDGKKDELPIPPERSVVTRHSVRIDGRSIGYKATAGTLLIKDDKDKPAVSVFYVAYTVDDGKPDRRPVTFMFNGGPGSSSMWLHMGSFGPVRVANKGDQPIPPPPYQTVPNEYSLLDKTDLVFVDAPGTGYSQLVGAAKGKDYYGVDQDAAAFAKFITRYVGDNHRWNSPKFLFGESYGTTRSAVLVKLLQQQGMEFNGVVLMSSILDFSVWANTGVDHAYVVNLPTEAAIAWYHDKVPGKPADLAGFLADVRRFAGGDYTLALAKGDALAPAEADRIADRLSKYIGLSPTYIKEANLRIDPSRFRKELLRDQRRTVGRLDGRFEGIDPDAAGETPDGDAASDAATGAYLAAFNQYVATELKFSGNRSYLPNNYGVINRGWDWKHKQGRGFGFTQAPYVGSDLASAMRRNPHLKVFSANGYYDLATPFYATEFDLGHLGLDPSIRKNIEFGFYPSGHMIYFDIDALKQVKADLARFYDEAAPRT
ncbi:S10 family peptidase [Rhodanobacter ginsengisoli]|uniref:S10 family peptidase n=1 Tax=Rhodanobacter ginsengisoli TaxID=418646 RepID=A0ABW0QHK8_9GAMM